MRLRIISALVAALLYSFFLNSGTLAAIWNGTDTLAHTGIRPGSIDEAHTFALMREVAEGHLLLGSASLREHRSDGNGLTYGPMLQGALLRITGWDIATVVWIGDFFFPAFSAFMLALALAPLFPPLPAAGVALIGMHAIGVRWLRSINPQVSFFFFAVFLLLFLSSKRTPLRTFLRGIFAGLLIIVHIHYALFAMLLEGCESFRRLFRKEPWYSIGKDFALFLLPIFFLVALKLFLLFGTTDPLAIADTQRRLGLIPSHLPAAPLLQIAVACTLVVLLFLRFQKSTSDAQEESLERFALLLLAGLIALNQSILHGRDAIFGVYYQPVLMLSVWIALCMTVWKALPHPFPRGAALSLLLLLTSVNVGRSLQDLSREQASQHFPRAETMEVISWAASEPGEQVIAAPLDIADLVPVLTPHSVLFNRYARFGSATDRELAERYLLLRALFGPIEDEDGTYGLVFGQYAGNLAARKRTLCTLRSFLLRRKEHCAENVLDHIYHRDVLASLEEGEIDPSALLQKFHVTILITQERLPDELTALCTPERELAGYRIARCTSGDMSEAAAG